MIRLLAGGIAAVVAIGVAAPAAHAADAGSGYSAAVYGNAGSLTVQADGTGLLGGTLKAALTPLVSALNAAASDVAGAVVNGLANSGFVANAGTTSQSPPASGYPDCSASGWDSSNCYSATSGGTTSSGGVLSLNLNAVQGYATGDSTGYYAAARVANPALTAVGVSVGNLGVVTSSASCTNDGACAAASAVSGVSLFGGAVLVQTASGGSGALQFSTDGGSTWTDVSAISAPVSVGTTNVTLTADGSLLHVRIGIALTQLLSTLGLGGLLSALSDLDTSATSIYMTVTLASGRSTSSGSTGWGLSVGVDLSGTVSISQSSLLSGLLGSASIAIPSGMSTDPSALGNLVTLELAYTAATAGQNPSNGATWYPESLI